MVEELAEYPEQEEEEQVGVVVQVGVAELAVVASRTCEQNLLKTLKHLHIKM